MGKQTVGRWKLKTSGSRAGEVDRASANFTGGWKGDLYAVGDHDTAVFVSTHDGTLWRSTRTIQNGKELLQPIYRHQELQDLANGPLAEELFFRGATVLPAAQLGTPGDVNRPPPVNQGTPNRPTPSNPAQRPTPTPPGYNPDPSTFVPAPTNGAGISGSLTMPDGSVQIFDLDGVPRAIVSRGVFNDIVDGVGDIFGGGGGGGGLLGGLGGIGDIGEVLGDLLNPFDFLSGLASAFDPFADQGKIEDRLREARDELQRGIGFAGSTERQSLADSAQRQRDAAVAAGNAEQGGLKASRDLLRDQYGLQGRTLNPLSKLGLESQENLAGLGRTQLSGESTFTPGAGPLQFGADPNSGLSFNAATGNPEQFGRNPNLGQTFQPQTTTGQRFTPHTSSGDAFGAQTRSNNVFAPQTDQGARFTAPTQSGARFTAPIDSGNRFTAPTRTGQRFTAPTASGQRYTADTDFGQIFNAQTDSGAPFNPNTAFNFTRDDLANDAGFQFRLEQGQQAIDRSAAARGGLVSGRTLAAAQEFGQGLAATEFDAAFRRAEGAFQNQFGREAAVFDRNAQEFHNAFQRKAQQFGINATEFMQKFTREDRAFSQQEQQFADEFQRQAQSYGINADEFAQEFGREAQKFGIQEGQFADTFQRGAQQFDQNEQQFADEFQRAAQQFGVNATEFAAKFGRDDRVFTQQEQQFADNFQRMAQSFGLNADEFAAKFGRQRDVFQAGEQQLGEEFGRNQAVFDTNANVFNQDFQRGLQGYTTRNDAFRETFGREAASFDRNATEFGANFARQSSAFDKLQQANQADFDRQFQAFSTNQDLQTRRDTLRLQDTAQTIDRLSTSASLGQQSRNLLAQLDSELSRDLSAAEAAPALAAAANILRQGEINSQEALGLGASAAQQDMAIANARATAENALAQARADMQARHAQLLGSLIGGAMGFGFNLIEAIPIIE